jgi:hypothetical protein
VRPAFLLFLLLSLPAAARAQNYYNADQPPPAQAQETGASRTFVVTSIEKCYAQLARADVLDIQKNYLRPYEECKKRLAAKIRAEQKLKAGEEKGAARKEEAKDAAPAAAAPPPAGGFYRVQKPKKPDAPPPAAAQ